jgi:hypothetical protein
MFSHDLLGNPSIHSLHRSADGLLQPRFDG